MILACTPYRTDLNLGKAYNDAFKLIGDDDYLLITDYDVLMLLPEQIQFITEYTVRYSGADLLVCWTNRTFPTNAQLYNKRLNEDSDIRQHISTAKYCCKELYNVTEIKQDISGFLMVIPKRTWNEIKFTEDLKCLGVDTDFSRNLLSAGKTIYRMEGIYVWHTYRIDKGIKDKSHLI